MVFHFTLMLAILHIKKIRNEALNFTVIGIEYDIYPIQYCFMHNLPINLWFFWKEKIWLTFFICRFLSASQKDLVKKDYDEKKTWMVILSFIKWMICIMKYMYYIFVDGGGWTAIQNRGKCCSILWLPIKLVWSKITMNNRR